MDKTLANLGLEEHSHRIALQKTVANSVLSIAVVLFLAAIFFGGVLIHAIANQEDGDAIHWHASILVAAFVVPPTLLVIALVRSAYQVKDAPLKSSDSTPAIQFFKELTSALRDVFKKD